MLADLVDIGANLTHDSFDADRAEVVARARAAGVAQFVVTGSSVAVSAQAADLAAANPGVMFATAGIHPHHASELDGNSIPSLRELCARREVVAVGEAGLDYFRNFSTHDEQAQAFDAQLSLAADLDMPVFLHQRDGHDAFLEIIEPWLGRIPRAVAHCFTGDADELERYLALGLYIGVTGWICDERRGLHLRELVGRVPPDRLMIETDAPYLLPRDLRPKPKSRRNEPMHLVHILHTVAQCCGRPVEQLAKETTENARRFFALPVPPDN